MCYVLIEDLISVPVFSNTRPLYYLHFTRDNGAIDTFPYGPILLTEVLNEGMYKYISVGCSTYFKPQC